MARLSTFVLATLIWTVFSSTGVVASCVSGSNPSYGDVSAIQYSQNGCNSTFQNMSLPKLNFTEAFDCSTFWALFYDLGRGGESSTYSQFSLKGDIGTFTLDVTLQQARELLENDKFYALSSAPFLIITDSAVATLFVRRCSVVTSIRVYNTVGTSQDAEVMKLFSDFRALIKTSAYQRTSNDPLRFNLGGLFNELQR